MWVHIAFAHMTAWHICNMMCNTSRARQAKICNEGLVKRPESVNLLEKALPVFSPARCDLTANPFLGMS